MTVLSTDQVYQVDKPLKLEETGEGFLLLKIDVKKLSEVFALARLQI